LNETDIYRELAPPASLRGALACIWVRRGTEEPVRVMPDSPHLTRECKALTGLSPGRLLTSSSRAQAADRRALHGLAAECARAALIEREERGRQGPAEAPLALEP
jgi:hypothetical protein